MRGLAVLLSALLLAACGGGSPEPQAAVPQDDACALPTLQREVSFAMAQKYYWHENMATPNAAAATIDQYFDSLLYKPTDRYSATEPTTVYDQRVIAGLRVGYGYTLVRPQSQPDTVRVRNVEPLGPAAAAGLQRGDTVLAIDGFTSQQVIDGAVPAVDEPGVARVVEVRRVNGEVRELHMVSAEFGLTPASLTATLQVERAGGTTAVGYLAYNSFAVYGTEAVGQAMQSFVDAGVRLLVMDLRYNGGGSVAVARNLASMIGGAATEHRLFAYLRFNRNQLHKNRSYVFASPGDESLPGPSLQGLERLIVITSGSTASASELLINGLRPFVPVTLVGATTYGKPYGSVTQSHCGTTYHAIQFTTVNADGQANYAQGFAADCEVSDDLDRALGDPQERRLATALHVARTGQCPAVPAQRVAKEKGAPRVFGEVEPAVMFAD